MYAHLAAGRGLASLGYQCAPMVLLSTSGAVFLKYLVTATHVDRRLARRCLRLSFLCKQSYR